MKKLYEDGNTPSIARQVFLKDLKQSCNDEMTYDVTKADRSITPRKRDVNYLYGQFTKEQFGGKNGEMFQKLEEKMEEYLKKSSRCVQTYKQCAFNFYVIRDKIRTSHYEHCDYEHCDYEHCDYEHCFAKNKEPIINCRRYGGGAGGNKKLDVKVELPPPPRAHKDNTIILDFHPQPHAITKGTCVI